MIESSPFGIPAGLYLGEGLLPVPEKLVPEKLVRMILKLEFIEMRDLIPKIWMSEEEDTNKTISIVLRRRPVLMTDILQWLQCYAALAGVLSKVYPAMVPKFTSYQAMIINCAWDFQGPAWAQSFVPQCGANEGSKVVTAEPNVIQPSLCW